MQCCSSSVTERKEQRIRQVLTVRSNSCTDKQRSQQRSARKLAHAWMRALAQTRRLASNECVARKGTTRLVATTNESRCSRERECCRCDYVQTRRVNESCVWHVDGKEIMICGQRPAGFVYAQAHKSNQQTTGRALGKGSGLVGFTTSVVHACHVLARCHSLITMANVSDCHKSQLVDYPHVSKMTQWRD